MDDIKVTHIAMNGQQRRPDLTFHPGDITQVVADAVVTGEGPYMERLSGVTRTLMRFIPQFTAIRDNLKRTLTLPVPLWTAQVSRMEARCQFKVVIHAFLDKGDFEQWKRHMARLYLEIFKKADDLRLMTLVIPLLGTGTAATSTKMAMDAFATSFSSFSSEYVRDIILVVQDGNIAKEITDIIHQKPKQGVFKKIMYSMYDRVRTDAYRNEGRHAHGLKFHRSETDEEKVYRRHHNTMERSKKDEKRKQQEDNDFQEAVKLSREEINRKRKDQQANKTHNRPHEEWLAQGKNARERQGKIGGKDQLYPENDEQLQLAMQLSLETEGNTGDDKMNGSWEDSDSDTPGTYASYNADGETLSCPICLCIIQEPKQLERCGHLFCKTCIDQSFERHKPVCPSCNMVYGIITGHQPEGSMDVGFSSETLPGFEEDGTITITYTFPGGIQGADHPNPGRPYRGTTRVAYLPDNRDGKTILRMLRTAFNRKLVFTIGRSTTTGKEDVVTWNDIHHKTKMRNGPESYGYPDPTYLRRVKEELENKGVKDD